MHFRLIIIPKFSNLIKNYVGISLENAAKCYSHYFGSLNLNTEISNLKPYILVGRGSVQFHCSTNEGFEGFLVNLLAFMDVDGAPDGPWLVE
jgi:hypothetical protein